jgi:hypothetical protein
MSDNGGSEKNVLFSANISAKTAGQFVCKMN